MKILAVDSCTNIATGAILNDGVIAAEFAVNNKTTHSEKLLPQIENMLINTGLTYKDIDLFAVTTGPGSFTGERIGVATAKALAHAVNKPVVGVSALAALAYNIAYTDYLICPIMDARRQQVYTAVFTFEDGKIKRIKPDSAMSAEDLLKEFDKDVIFIGDGVPVFKDIIEQKLGRLCHFAPAHLL
ncbi:MAG: tRNA (adenosine(37)-N6)-threonylcarbamoyltransferase complex dimerization subunit type 1 TsaB, partial [Clostridia bacterium]|nr:tRNA (adenosine(37)-N6)-threonylcarbamoyltransferase complex dimerization subunit type 1 TsaB [Clostridia bacterium]